MKQRFLAKLVVVLMILPCVSIAGTTGKIKGKVTDRETGEALIGASVLVVGTSLGAAADINGEFIILAVPAGTHELEGQFLGYQPFRISNVLVNSDLTTEVDFLMTALAEGVALQEIVVQRERELVSRNATNAVRIQTGEDIENLPIRGVTAAVALSPGIVQQDGKIFVRGGRATDVGYYLEGATTRKVIANCGYDCREHDVGIWPCIRRILFLRACAGGPGGRVLYCCHRKYCGDYGHTLDHRGVE